MGFRSHGEQNESEGKRGYYQRHYFGGYAVGGGYEVNALSATHGAEQQRRGDSYRYVADY